MPTRFAGGVLLSQAQTEALSLVTAALGPPSHRVRYARATAIAVEVVTHTSPLPSRVLRRCWVVERSSAG
jgi:hypothetical protein